jgi:xylulokinase
MRVLGIDAGTGGTRAVIVDENGRILVFATDAAVRKVLAGAVLRGDQIDGVGFSGQMQGAVMMDHADQVVRPALIWCDVRTGKQCGELSEKIGAERLIRLTCNPALCRISLSPNCCRYARMNRRTGNASVPSCCPRTYVRFRLTGDRASDRADASGTLLLDVANRRWSTEALRAAAIEGSLLPRSV